MKQLEEKQIKRFLSGLDEFHFEKDKSPKDETLDEETTLIEKIEKIIKS